MILLDSPQPDMLAAMHQTIAAANVSVYRIESEDEAFFVASRHGERLVIASKSIQDLPALSSIGC